MRYPLTLQAQPPSGPLRINRANRLGRDLAFLMPLRGGGEMVELVTGRLATRNGALASTASSWGGAPLFGSGLSVDFPEPPTITSATQPVTFAWVSEGRSTSSYSTILNWKPSFATYPFLIYRSASDSNFYFAVGPRNGSFSAVRFGTGAQSNNTPESFVLVCDSGIGAGGYRLYRNGIGVSQVGSPAFGANTTASARIGALDTGSDPFEGLISNLAIFSRALTDSEAASLSANPWQLYEGRRIWLPAQVAGGTTPVVTDAALAWPLRAAVETDAALTWPLRAPVDTDAALAWSLRAGVETDQALSWPLRAPVQTDAPLAWPLRGAVLTDQALAWDIEAADGGSVVTDQALSWALRGAVQTDAALAWPVRAAVTTDQAVAWPLRAAVQTDQALSWTLRAAVITQALLSWLLDGDGTPPPPLDGSAHPLLRFLLRPPLRRHELPPPQRHFAIRPPTRRIEVLQAGTTRTPPMPSARINAGAKLRYELDLRPTDTSKPAWLIPGDRLTQATWSVGAGLTKSGETHTDTTARVFLQADAGAVVGSVLVATCTLTTELGETDVRRLELEVVRE